METKTIISIEEARKILRKFDLPSELLEEDRVADIIDRLDSIADLYITGTRESHESQPTLEAQSLN